MKSVFKFIKAIAVIVLINTTANATTPSIKIEEIGAKSLGLFIENLDEQSLSISLMDANQNYLYQDVSVNEDSYATKLNLKNLPSGEYTVVIENDYFIKTQPVQVVYQGLIVKPEAADMVYKPTIRRNGDYLDLDMLLLTDQLVEISIIDYEGRVNFEDQILNERLIQKRFNLSHLETGVYNVFVSWYQNDVRHTENKSIVVE